MSVPGYDAATGLMDFSLALREMKKGKKVRRRSWAAHKAFVVMQGDDIVWHDGKGADFAISALLATDWEEVL